MLKLIDLIKLFGIELHNFKIHCAKPDDNEKMTPNEAFFDGTFRQWQERQSRKNFECEHILSLIHLEKDQWLFAGVYVVDDVKPGSWKNTPCCQYTTHEVTGLEDLTGKAIVQFKQTSRAPYLWGTELINNLLVVELRNQRMTIGDFPGYKSVLLSYRMLQTVVRESDPSWRTALSNVAGIYLITDVSNGKLYVGKASGGKGIWQRWTDYATYRHGGDEEIKKLLLKEGNSHAEHFQFSLLEVFDIDSGDDYVLKRETHWKTVLKTREFGLNKN